MKLTDQIFNLFSTDFELGELEYQDRYEGSCRTKTLGLPDENDLKSLVDKIPSRDSFIFTINYFGKFIEYGKDNNFTEFISNLKEEMQYDFEPDEDDFIELKLNISKHIETNVLSIYSLDSFEKYIISLNLKDLLGVISIINRLPRFIFNIQEDSQYELKSNRIAFTTDSDLDINGISGSLKRLVEVCNFQNSSQYYFSPDDFFIERTPTRPLEIIFDKLKVIFSLIYICDSSLILGDCLVANINGYRRIDLNLKFSSLDTSEYEYAFNVYRWIYSDGNLYDKIGLARNVISLHTSDNSLNISKNTFGSILSGFKIYLKDNVQRYIDVKNKISDHLFDLSKRYYSAADEITTTFKQNFIAFITFFTSIFVLQTISTGKISNIFTSDISLISYALLLISAIYLVATFINFIIKRSRIDRDYFNLKNKYSDVLEIQDVERIFGFDEDHMKLKRNLMIQAILLSLSWLLSLVVFSVAIFLLTGEGKATDSPNKHSLSDSRISSIIAASIDVEKECEDNKDTLDLASKHIDENRPKPAAPPEGSVGLPKAPVKPTKSKGVTSVRQQAG